MMQELPLARARAAAGLALLAALPLALAPTARAQVDTKSKAPIDITADEAEVTNSRCLTIWRGAAEAVQDKARLRADTITVYSTPKGVDANGRQSCGGADRIVADGHVYYVTPQQNARGDHAVYSHSQDQIVITGNVIVVQGNDVARGDRLTLTISTRDAKMESDTTGFGRPGRVRGVFYPNQDDSKSGTTKP
jgi:lipopolysaccharide export system protein LptA